MQFHKFTLQTKSPPSIYGHFVTMLNKKGSFATRENN